MKRTANYENAHQIFQRVKSAIKTRNAKPELPTGLKALDEITHGLRRGKVTIIAARPSEGKTSLGIQIALNLADATKTVAYVSLEDDRAQLLEKMFCNMQKIDNYSLMRGEWSKDCDIKAEIMDHILKNLSILVLDGFGYNWDEFQYVIEKTEPKPDVIFLDYINMIELANGQNKRDAVSEFVRSAKQWSLRSNIAVVILAQINRSGAEDSRPRLHHLKDSGTLEEVADVVLINYYPFRYGDKTFKDKDAAEDYLEIEVAKNKCGRPGMVPVRFTGRYYRFEDWIEEPFFERGKSGG